MKRFKTILSTVIFSFFIFQISYSQCENTALDYLAANQIKAAVTAGADFFWNRNDGQFIVPYTPGPFQETSTILAGGLWLGAMDAGGNLKTACQTYGNSNWQADYWGGPIDETTFGVFPNGCENFNHVWKVNRGDILQLTEDFADNGVIDGPIPASIQAWPARGNPHFAAAMGFALPDQDLAPFFDNNGNGLYEPLNGDFPLIDASLTAAVPDEMTWTVFNDIQDLHAETQGVPLGVEVHFMTYAFNCSDNEVLNHTVFTRHKIFNKSPQDLIDLRMGLWLDIDVGCWLDDYFGCDTTLNAVYFYNQDNDDNDPQCTGIGTYGENPPVQAAHFLNQKMSKLTYHNNPAFGNPPPPIVTTDPATAVEFYNALSGLWRDGTPLTFGGQGYDPGNNDFVDYPFFDNPNDPNGWSMENLLFPNVDSRVAMSVGPEILTTGSSIILDAAFSYHRQPGADRLENVNVALDAIPSIQSFYDSGLFGSCSQLLTCNSDCVWPGDGNDDGIAKNDDLLHLGIAMGQGASGAPRAPTSTLWIGQNADDWSGTLPGGTNQKFADFNGDGELSELDLYILELNYFEKKPDYVLAETQAPIVAGELYLDLDEDVLVTSDNQLKRLIVGDIILASDNAPIENLYALSFTIKYDTSVWTVSFLPPVDLIENGIFGPPGEVLIIGKVVPEEGRIDIAISRKDGQAISNASGKLGEIILLFREDATTSNLNGEEELSFQFYDAVGVGAQEDFFELGAESDIVLGTEMTVVTSVKEKYSDDISLEIVPNPNSGSFDLLLDKNTSASQIGIFDFQGRAIWKGEVPAGSERHAIQLSDDSSTGVYFLKMTTTEGYFTTRKVIVK